MGKEKSKSGLTKHKLKFIFLGSFAVLMAIIFVAALLFHLKRFPVHVTMMLALPVLFFNAYYSARHTMVLGTVVSNAILGFLYIAAGFQFLIQLQVYVFWYQTIQVKYYVGLMLGVGVLSAFMAIFAAQLSFRQNYRRMERKRRQKHKDKYGQAMPHPDFIKVKQAEGLNSSNPS